MYKKRIIPCILLSGERLIKTTNFKNPIYIGDPINTVRIFREKEVDEIVILDIDATKYDREPNYDLIAKIAGECFMPITYGGGIKNINQVRKIIRSGVEKIVINSAAYHSIDLISDVALEYGSQSIVGCMDIGIIGDDYALYSNSGLIYQNKSIISHLNNIISAGIGELFINCIHRDGTMMGYDLSIIKNLIADIEIPVVLCGGAKNIEDISTAMLETGASCAAGALFVYYGKNKAVLINYPKKL